MFNTKRLHITKYNLSMAKVVSELSKDLDNRKYLPDEVFETEEIAYKVLTELIEAYNSDKLGVYPILLNDDVIGHIEIISLGESYEIGYHIGSKYIGHGYATEALNGFLEYLKDNTKIDRVYGICLKDNIKSIKVLERVGFKLEYDGIGEYQGEMKPIVKYVKELK